MLRFRFAALAALALLSACDAVTHNPSGENPVEIDPTPTPLSIDLVNAPDSLVVWDNVGFKYELPASETREVPEVEVYLGGALVQTAPNTGYVWVNTSVVGDGLYTLRISAKASSATGSLADELGAETVSGDVTRVLVVDNAPVEASPITYGTVDGLLEVRWQPRPRPSFQSYRLYRVSGSGYRRLVFETDNPEQTSWADEEFFAGEVSYAVDVSARDETAPGVEKTKSAEAPVLAEVTQITPYRYRLRWTAAEFPGALQTYRILRSDEAAFFDAERAVLVASTTDTTVTVDVPKVFGTAYQYRLRVYPASGFVYNGGASDVIRPDPVAPFSGIQGVLGEALLRTDGQRLLRYASDDFAPLGSYTAPGPIDGIAVSRDEKVVVFSRQGGSTPGRVVEYLDGNSFSVLGRFVQEDVFESPLSILGGGSAVSGNGRLLARYGEYVRSEGTYYDGLGVLSVDLRTGDVENRIDATGKRPPAYPSRVNYQPYRVVEGAPDGKYSVLSEGAQPGLYEADANGAFVKLRDLDPEYRLDSRLVFVTDTRLAVASGDRLLLRDLPSMEIVLSVPLASSRVQRVSYDNATGLLFALACLSDEPSDVVCKATGLDPATGTAVFEADAGPYTQFLAGLLWSEGSYRRVVQL